MMGKGGNRGFTLIEILVALGITSLLTVILYASFTGLTRSAAALEDYSEKYRQMVLFMNQLSNDMAGAFYSSSLPYSNFSLTEKNVGGENFSELSFSCFSRQFLHVDPRGTDIIRVTYKPEIDDDGKISLYREIDLNLQIPSYSETLKEPVLSGIDSLSILAISGEDSEESEWEAESKMKLPDTLRITIAFPGGQVLLREYYTRLAGDVSKFGNSGKRSK